MKKHGFETCTECSEIFNCEIFSRRKVAEWIPAADNLHRIKKVGLKNWLKDQKERQRLIEKLLQNYNEGRSMSLYCKSCARMPIDMIEEAIKKAKEKLTSEKVNKSDMKLKARILKTVIKDFASKVNISLD